MHTSMKVLRENPLPRSLDFKLPNALQCSLPSELRGMARDEVRLMISGIKGDEVRHSHFYHLAEFLRPGDALVVNTSATLKAALDILDARGNALKVHLSNRLGPNRWLVELREPMETKTQRWFGGAVGDIFQLQAGGRLQLLKAYYQPADKRDHLQLWVAEFYIDQPLDSYLEAHGQPIRYLQAKAGYPADWYQTYFAQEPGSAEMPSAGRAFTERVVKDLETRGIPIIPLLLHTGVASVEADERPYEEYYRLSPE
ncbi:MAG: S-adenosylmethionine:tRNA ribosyltransferase-isomerase, partial [Bacteroidota bacterium]